MPLKSTRKLPETRKWQFPSSTMIVEILVSANAEPSISWSEGGSEIVFNDRQARSTYLSIRVSFDPDSNINEESEWQPQKAYFPIHFTAAGRQVDRNAQHCQNALD
jgi:hypothetical protein